MMNTSNILRFLNRSSCSIYRKHKHVSEGFQHIYVSRMATEASVTQKSKESFQDVLPSIIETLTTNKALDDVPEVGKWLKKVLNYNLIGGKQARGLTTLYAYETLEKPEKITEESIRQAKTLGWCVEMLQAYLVILDDIMDGSSTRRGAPCWFRAPEVGMGAINDAVLVHSSLYHLLKIRFSHLETYTDMLELFNETLLYTSVGQHLDVTMERRQKSDLSLFTIERYNAIVKYKTAYYTYKLPVCLGLLLANNRDPAVHKKAEDICIEIGKFFQMQDDYIDCYSEERVSGKAGTDIQEAKCSWLAVQALHRATPAQRVVFAACYGSPEPAHIERIKELYRVLGLPAIYAAEETRLYEALRGQARALPPPLAPELFLRLIDMIYRRTH